jgi:hypothetical protein
MFSQKILNSVSEHDCRPRPSSRNLVTRPLLADCS